MGVAFTGEDSFAFTKLDLEINSNVKSNIFTWFLQFKATRLFCFKIQNDTMGELGLRSVRGVDILLARISLAL